VSILCCTYSNGPVTFSVCEKDTACPVLSGYPLVRSIPTPNCSVCTDSNNKKKEKEAHLESQGERKMRIK